jgi:hypothetical protein
MIRVSKTKGGHSIPSLKMDKVSYRQIGNVIREHQCDILVETPEGWNFTNETLFRVAFEGILPSGFSDDRVDMFLHAMEIERLYEIIENGGIQSYVSKKSRGFI